MNSNNNSSRIAALDLARIIGMLMMIQGHVIDSLAPVSIANVNDFPWNIWHFFRGVTAPIFLIVSGAVQVFANNRDQSGLLNRLTINKRVFTVFKLLFIGYFLNLPVRKIYDLIYIDSSLWQSFYQVNILQLLAMTLVIVLLIYFFTRTDSQLGVISLVLGIIFCFATPLVQSQPWFVNYPDFIGEYFSLEHGSHFAIFPFSGYMLFGIYLGTTIKSVSKENRLIYLKTKLPVYGLLIGLLGIPLYYIFLKYPYNFPNVNNANPGMVLIRTGIVLEIIGAVTFLYSKFEKYSEIFSFFGQRALFVYIAHIIILYGLLDMPSIGRVFNKNLEMIWVYISVAAVLSLSLLFVLFIGKTSQKYSFLKPVYRSIIVFYILYILFY
ncbi:MAG: heparan-alpha-glucosaminide N-acetyltransferase domain-containing protein [Candidatus Kapabacteria bacterium]|nr:heparan-alpha-glucosaminide N-acetyltransferase domain-containing protein [Candidatus Kapabacteria bacterium]